MKIRGDENPAKNIMADRDPSIVGDSHRWVVFIVISTIYFFVYFHRVSTSVIAHDILIAFNTNATALGFMSSMYFYLYAFEQPLVGYYTDKLGARRVIAYCTLVAAAGCFMFAFAPSIAWASAGRALIGIGVGGVYVPAVKAFSQWFKINEFATMMGLLLAIGNFGAIIATTPLAWVANHWGWRISFNVIGLISLALALAALFMIKDFKGNDKTSPVHGHSGPAGADSPKTSFYKPLSSPQFWIIGVTFAGVYGIVLTFQGLWATPFLMAVLNTDRIAASQLNMVIPIGFIIGAPLFGRLSDTMFKSKVQIIHLLLGILTLSWAGIVFGMKGGIVWIFFILFLMGMAAGGFINLLWTHVRDITPPRILGSFSGLLNPAPFLGVAVFQVLTGSFLDGARLVNGAYPAEAYESSFVLCLIVSCACFLLSFFLKEKKAEPL
jgi:predicted MFS family arabinose efflux permease